MADINISLNQIIIYDYEVRASRNTALISTDHPANTQNELVFLHMKRAS